MTNKADFKRMMIRLAASLLCLVSCACGTESQRSGPGFRNVDSFPLERLSQYDFLKGNGNLTPCGRCTVSSDLTLWADHAGKARFIVYQWARRLHRMVMKTGTSQRAQFSSKTFSSTDRRAPEETVAPIETRLMIKTNG